MRALDPRYSGLRQELDRYGQQYLDAQSRKSVKKLAVIGILAAGAIACLLAGAWIARTNYIITFVNL